MNLGYSQQANNHQGANIQLKQNQSNTNKFGYQSQIIQDSKTSSIKKCSHSNGEICFSNVPIISKKANKVLDICQDKGSQGILIIYQDYKQPNQRFDIIHSGQGFNIRCRKTDQYLTVAANSQKNGAPIFQQPSSGMIGQKFRLAQVQNGEYLIHTFCGKVLDCCEQSTQNGTRIIQFRCDRTEHQRWIIPHN